MINETDILETLGARYYAYQVMRSIFGVEPSAAQFEVIQGSATSEAFEMLFEQTCCDDSWRKPLQEVVSTSYEEKIFDEYTRLFLGPGHIEAPPWESIYVSEQPLLFQECTIDVRKHYLAQGYIPKQFPHVPDDQLSIELDFMEKLAVKAYEEFYADRQDELKDSLCACHSFLEEHLCKWAEPFRERVEDGEGGFYAAAATLLEKYAAEDKAYLTGLEKTLQRPNR